MPVIKPKNFNIRAGRKPNAGGKATTWLQIRVTPQRKAKYKQAANGKLSAWILETLDEKLPKDDK